mmetsp:Transcript_2755/g.8561  ORF Transcript_2755/g.8561 Transcript_2755/m.8561 type:complete len:135 (-) Transcript_2755:434-838(-)
MWPIAISVFRPILGIATVWLRRPDADAALLAGAVHLRAWMAPTCITTVADPDDDAATAALSDYAAQIPKGSRLPRRLMTCEPWVADPTRDGPKKTTRRAATPASFAESTTSASACSAPVADAPGAKTKRKKRGK